MKMFKLSNLPKIICIVMLLWLCVMIYYVTQIKINKFYPIKLFFDDGEYFFYDREKISKFSVNEDIVLITDDGSEYTVKLNEILYLNVSMYDGDVYKYVIAHEEMYKIILSHSINIKDSSESLFNVILNTYR